MVEVRAGMNLALQMTGMHALVEKKGVTNTLTRKKPVD